MIPVSVSQLLHQSLNFTVWEGLKRSHLGDQVSMEDKGNGSHAKPFFHFTGVVDLLCAVIVFLFQSVNRHPRLQPEATAQRNNADSYPSNDR